MILGNLITMGTDGLNWLSPDSSRITSIVIPSAQSVADASNIQK